MWTPIFRYDAEEADGLRRYQDHVPPVSASSSASPSVSSSSSASSSTYTPASPTVQIPPGRAMHGRSVESHRAHDDSRVYDRSSTAIRSPVPSQPSHRWTASSSLPSTSQLSSRHGSVDDDGPSSQSARTPVSWQQRGYNSHQAATSQYPTQNPYYQSHQGREQVQSPALTHHQAMGARSMYYPLSSTAQTLPSLQARSPTTAGWPTPAGAPMFQQGTPSPAIGSFPVDERGAEGSLSTSTSNTWSQSLPQQSSSPYLARRGTQRHDDVYYAPSPYPDDDDRSMYDGEGGGR